MFGWLKRRKRQVFCAQFPDGSKLHYDPIRVRMELNQRDPKWADKVDELSLAQNPLPAGTPAEMAEMREGRRDKLCYEIATLSGLVFELPPLTKDGTGFTDAERLTILSQYLGYCVQSMESARPLAAGDGSTA